MIEVQVLLEILLLEERNIPVLVSATGHQTKEYHIASGESVAELCGTINRIRAQEQELYAQDSLLSAFGFNCTPPSKIQSLLHEAKAHLKELPLVC